jgi:hypothetical protein
MATSLRVLARLPLLLLQKADAVHSNVEWHPFEHMQASARSSQGPSWSAGGDGGMVGSLLHWYTAVLPLSCAVSAMVRARSSRSIGPNLSATLSADADPGPKIRGNPP